MNIALVCDFFYPRLGGVEMHIYSLAQCLARLGNRVIVITHAYDASASPIDNTHHRGVRYFPGPIKVYYCPILPMTDQVTLPTFTATFPLLRWIFIREQIHIVHAHQATSTMANEAIVYAGELGIPSVYTDHSLFDLQDFASRILNGVLTTTLSTVRAVICVSHACRDNLILRARIDPSIVHIIPNAIDATKFLPVPSKRSQQRIKVIVISRLVYRKGVDLLVGIIPIICRRHMNVDFIVGGDGSRKIYLDEMIEREKLQDRVTTLGAIPHKDVSSILVQGHIFLNCSLTESFCIAILEAASCGLYVVSTNVGGIPEVLPHDSMMRLSEPSVSSMTKSLSEVIETKIYTDAHGCITTNFDSFQLHENIRTMYSWDYVAIKTMAVYREIINLPPLTFWQRSERYRSVGDFGGCIACILHFLLFVVVKVMEWNQPRHLIDVVPSLLDTCDLDLKETHIQNGDVN